jgi:hypothetical protein
MKYKGYTIMPAVKSGGKAGKGKNNTTSMQVRQEVPGGYLVKKNYVYNPTSHIEQNDAIAKCQAHVDKLVRGDKPKD